MPATTPPPVADLQALASLGTMPALMRQLAGLAGCTRPIRLDGWRTEVHAPTGEVLHHLESSKLPAGHLLVRCGNRRATRCASCAETYRRDTYHLITAGLIGGKGVPATVAAHPRVFATFTAPSFGPVHNRPTGGPGRTVHPCRCGIAHGEDDPLLGTPIDPDTYDYRGAVLWNFHSGALWARFTIHLRRELAKRAGLTQRDFKEHARVSFGKVAEYQRRGLVHFHAVIRLDGPEGGNTPPPPWATAELLADAIRAAAARACPPALLHDGRTYEFRFGRQLDIRTIRSADFDGPAPITERAVAAYIAKYATKGAETATGALDRPIRFLAELAHLDITDHARRMVRTCWELGGHRDFADSRLRAWAHMLGFRGHFSTKTRRYSTTLGALRDARAAWRRAPAAELRHGPDAPADDESTLVLAHWVFAGVGLSPGETWLTQALTPAPGTEGEPTRA
ncbi:replication initiator [Peterkaempfera griseoplana]|uniref:replication initiator n=1 Tax=Peterkaempfera griseoplana TaxID=66896 RepID=UPI000A787E95|nr:replication initiator [Peterkaempfera griseoplana]